MCSANVVRIGINGISITAPSMNKINLAACDQTREVTAKRLHDGIDDTFVSSVADTMVQSIRLCARGVVHESI